MRIGHLNFEQLHRLYSPATLMRVTRVYHCALRDGYDETHSIEPFTVSLAECWCPEIKVRYKPVLDFITSEELREAVVRATWYVKPRWVSGAAQSIARIWFIRFCGNRVPAKALVTLIKAHTEAVGCPTVVQETPEYIEVLGQTDETGAAIVLYHPGPKLYDLAFIAQQLGSSFDELFPWIPRGVSSSLRLNAIHKPVNSADGLQHCADHNYYLNK